MYPLVSVVMSVFNGVHFLAEAVDSILDQSLADLELIVVDDGSTDASPAILDSYQRRDPRVRVYHEPHRGQVEALNRGCSLARGRYIARMDADDVALPSRLRRQLDFLETHPEVGLVGGAVAFIDRRGTVLRTVHLPTQDREVRAQLLDANLFFHPATMFRRELFVALGGYREMAHAEDYDLWLRFADACRLANLAEIVLFYRIHPHQISVQRCLQQGLGAVAARAAAWTRRHGHADPLTPPRAITPQLIAELGVGAAVVQTELARTYLACIRNMIDIGEDLLALEALDQLPFSELPHADAWVVADLRLQAARVHWRQRRWRRSLLGVGEAIVTRPVVLARPLKRLLPHPWSARLASRRRLRSRPQPSLAG